MIRPAQHVLLGQGRGEGPEPPGPSYPVTTALVGLWDWNDYSYGVGDPISPLPDLSGNGNNMTLPGTQNFFYRSGFIDSNQKTASIDGIMNVPDIKATPFTMVIRVTSQEGASSIVRYYGFETDALGDPNMRLAADGSIRFNNGSISFPGPLGGAGTIVVRNIGDGTVDIFVDGMEVVSGASIPGGALDDIFSIGDAAYSTGFVFAALHKAALNGAEIDAIQIYAAGAGA